MSHSELEDIIRVLMHRIKTLEHENQCNVEEYEKLHTEKARLEETKNNLLDQLKILLHK